MSESYEACFEASFILAPGFSWTLGEAVRYLPYRCYVADEDQSMAATLKPRYRPKRAVIDWEAGGSLDVGHLVSLEAERWPDANGHTLLVTLKTRDADAAHQCQRGSRGRLRIELWQQATGETKVFDQLPTLEVIEVVPSVHKSVVPELTIRFASVA